MGELNTTNAPACIHRSGETPLDVSSRHTSMGADTQNMSSEIARDILRGPASVVKWKCPRGQVREKHGYSRRLNREQFSSCSNFSDGETLKKKKQNYFFGRNTHARSNVRLASLTIVGSRAQYIIFSSRH